MDAYQIKSKLSISSIEFLKDKKIRLQFLEELFKLSF